ncbi:MAG TPA: 3-hydroxyacyl-CoA dehydrogenase family protein, partial [Trueperaceae bacterium]
IDRALCLGLNYPRGPLAWSETLGLAAALDALEGIHRELGEARYRPHPLWRRAVAAGLTRWSEL